MTPDLTVVFPAAHTRGGVERIAYEVLRYAVRKCSTRFVGSTFENDDQLPVTYAPVAAASKTQALAPLRFRRDAAATLRSDRGRRVLSFGANCPPGDCYWVQSVHRAWLTTGSTLTVRGLRVPSSVRRLLPRHRVLLHMERQYFTHHRPDAIICTSRREAMDLQTLYGVEASILHVIPNGFNGERFNNDTRVRWRQDMRATLGLRPEDVSLLFPVNELHRKGFATLLEAVALAGDTRVRIDVVGRVSPHDYRARIRSLGLTDRICWHGPSRDVQKFMAAADLLVLPTQYEPFGLVIVEALAMGLPVITTRLAGAADAVREGVVGLLQENPTSAEELSALLARGLDDDVRNAWSQHAPGAAAPYEWNKVLDRAFPLIMRETNPS